MKLKRSSSCSVDLFGTLNAQAESPLAETNIENRARVVIISSPLVEETEDWLSKRALTLGNMLSSERAAEYVACLRALAQFREEHEPEPLHEDVELKVCGEDADAFAVSAFKNDIRQLKEWNLITERIEKERLRGYRGKEENYTDERVRQILKGIMPQLEKYRFLHKVKPSADDSVSEIETIFECLPAMWHYQAAELAKPVTE